MTYEWLLAATVTPESLSGKYRQFPPVMLGMATEERQLFLPTAQKKTKLCWPVEAFAAVPVRPEMNIFQHSEGNHSLIYVNAG